jgi:hypothetical protein
MLSSMTGGYCPSKAVSVSIIPPDLSAVIYSHAATFNAGRCFSKGRPFFSNAEDLVLLFSNLGFFFKVRLTLDIKIRAGGRYIMSFFLSSSSSSASSASSQAAFQTCGSMKYLARYHVQERGAAALGAWTGARVARLSRFT